MREGAFGSIPMVSTGSNIVSLNEYLLPALGASLPILFIGMTITLDQWIPKIPPIEFRKEVAGMATDGGRTANSIIGGLLRRKTFEPYLKHFEGMFGTDKVFVSFYLTGPPESKWALGEGKQPTDESGLKWVIASIDRELYARGMGVGELDIKREFAPAVPHTLENQTGWIVKLYPAYWRELSELHRPNIDQLSSEAIPKIPPPPRYPKGVEPFLWCDVCKRKYFPWEICEHLPPELRSNQMQVGGKEYIWTGTEVVEAPKLPPKPIPAGVLAPKFEIDIKDYVAKLKDFRGRLEHRIKYNPQAGFLDFDREFKGLREEYDVKLSSRMKAATWRKKGEPEGITWNLDHLIRAEFATIQTNFFRSPPMSAEHTQWIINYLEMILTGELWPVV